MDVVTLESNLPDLVELNNPAHAFLTSERLRKSYRHGIDYCISRSSGGRLLGGVLYSHYTRTAIAMHVASFSPNWLSRALLYWVFEYPFNMLRVDKALAIVPEDKPSHNLALRLGFGTETRLTDVLPDGDMVVLGMRKDGCRWLDEPPRNRAIIIHPGGPDVVRR